MREKAPVNDYKIVEVIEGLSRMEIKKLGSYLASPYFNQSKKISIVYKFLTKNLPRLKAGKISKSNLWNAVYKDKKFNDATLRKLIFEFAALVRNFILLELAPQSEGLRDYSMLQFYRLRKMNKSFELALNQSRKSYKNKFTKFSTDYYESMLVEMEAYNFAGDNLSHNADHLTGVTERLNLFFILNKLEHFYDVIKFREAYDSKLQFDYDFYNEVQQYMEDNIEHFKQSHPNIYAEYLSFMSVTASEPKTYIDELTGYLLANENRLNKSFLKQYFIVVYNFYVNRVNKGDVEARHDLFEVTRLIEEKNLAKGIFGALDLYVLSAVIIALSFDESEWAEMVIQKYEIELPKKSRDEVLSIANAYLRFHFKKFEDTLDFLSGIKRKNTMYYLYANTLTIKTYFELGDYEPIYSLVDTMNHFLDRKTIAEYSIQSYRNFLKFVLKMVKLNGDEYERHKLKEEIEKYNILNSKDWLLEKLT